VDESGDSSDDEPLVKMIRKPPTDCQLSERVKALLKYTDMADVTMKQIYNRVRGHISNVINISRSNLKSHAAHQIM
jgi:protein DEK